MSPGSMALQFNTDRWTHQLNRLEPTFYSVRIFRVNSVNNQINMARTFYWWHITQTVAMESYRDFGTVFFPYGTLQKGLWVSDFVQKPFIYSYRWHQAVEITINHWETSQTTLSTRATQSQKNCHHSYQAVTRIYPLWFAFLWIVITYKCTAMFLFSDYIVLYFGL